MNDMMEPGEDFLKIWVGFGVKNPLKGPTFR